MRRIIHVATAGLTAIAVVGAIEPTPAAAAASPRIDGFWLVDADTDTVLDYVEAGDYASFERAYLPDELSMRADATFDTESVMWQRDGDTTYQLENEWPWALNGDNGGDYIPAPFDLGSTDIAATAYTEDSQGGDASALADVTIHLYKSDFVVDTVADTHDANPGDGVCSIAQSGDLATSPEVCGLRAAIEEANATPGAQTISIDGRLGTYELFNGPLYIEDSVTLRGYRMPRISARGASKVFGVGFGTPDVLATLNGLRITDGNAERDFNRDGETRGGGLAVRNGSLLQLFDSVVERNRGNYGGGLYVSNSSLLLRGSVVRDNIGGTPDDDIDGGGITQRGGGLRIAGSSATIEDSSIHDNWAVRGGGLSIIDSNVKITNTSIVENRAEAIGGGMEVNGADTAFVSIAFSTIARNEAGAAIEPPDDHRRGGGIYNNGRVQIGNSILAENTDAYGAGDPLHAPDCYSPEKHRFTSMRGNVVGVLNDNCVMLDTNSGLMAGFQFGTEVAPLDPGFEGGTSGPNNRYGLRLANASVAVNAGTGVTSSTFFDCPAHDGFDRPRPVSAGCDAGALERQHVAIENPGGPNELTVGRAADSTSER